VTRSGARHDRLTSVPREGDAAEKTLTDTKRRYADTLDPQRERRLCDCSRCVRHAVDLHQTVYAGFPIRWGIRFARVPGVTVAAATLAELRRLEKKHIFLKYINNRTDPP